MKEELLKGLSDEQFEKARACKTSEELIQLAMDEGVELNDDQLEAISGGGCDKTPQSNANNGGISCPKCCSSNVTRVRTSVCDPTDSAYISYECLNCSYCW